MKIVYSDKYLKYHFDTGHPFWPERAEEFIKIVSRKSPSVELRINKGLEIVDAPKAKDEDILLVHTKEYLNRVKKLAKKNGYLTMDTQVNPDNLEAAYYSVGGTIKAAEIALKDGLAINLLGGLHHAETNNSSGFCIFNDHAVAIKRLQGYSPSTSSGQIENACVLDLDVHAGNGTQEIFYSDPTVLTISIHQDPTNFYPGTGFGHQTGEGEGKGFNINYPLPVGTEEKEYLAVLDRAIGEIEDYEPSMLFVILGVDTYKNDPLAGFKLERETYGKIALRLVSLAQGKPNIPMVVLFAGGYSKEVPELWWEFVNYL